MEIITKTKIPKIDFSYTELHEDFNPWHDPKTGRFTTGPKGSAADKHAYHKEKHKQHQLIRSKLREASLSPNISAAVKSKLQKRMDYHAKAMMLHDEHMFKATMDISKPTPAKTPSRSPKEHAAEQLQVLKSVIAKRGESYADTGDAETSRIMSELFERTGMSHKLFTDQIEWSQMTPTKLRAYPTSNDGYMVSMKFREGQIERIYSLDAKGKISSVDHTFFRLHDEFQGKGTAKRTLRSAFEHYAKMGIDKVTVHAALENGGYTWLKFGFKPHFPEALLAAARTKAERFSKQKRDSIDAVLQLDISPLAKVRALAASPIGKQLFKKSNWTGEFDMKDADSKAILNAYLGTNI